MEKLQNGEAGAAVSLPRVDGETREDDKMLGAGQAAQVRTQEVKRTSVLGFHALLFIHRDITKEVSALIRYLFILKSVETLKNPCTKVQFLITEAIIF